MTGYICERCPLAFEVGYRAFWDLPGGCDQLVCRHCGTMHRVEYHPGRPDTLLAVDGPVRSMVREPPGADEQARPSSWLRLPAAGDLWQAVGSLSAADEGLQGPSAQPGGVPITPLGHVACAHCGVVGGLVSDRQFGDNCPVCRGDLHAVYVDS
jgi:hypothetical protein